MKKLLHFNFDGFMCTVLKNPHKRENASKINIETPVDTDMSK